MGLPSKINSLTTIISDPNVPVDEKQRCRTKRRILISQAIPILENKQRLIQMPFCRIDKPIFLSKNIAIVGNAAELMKTEYGNEIDNFDIVIRFNSCVIEGYEKHVGKKVTHLFCTCHYYNNKRQRTGIDGQTYINKVNTRDFRNINVIAILNGPDGRKTLKNNNQFHNSVNTSEFYNYLNIQNEILSNIGCGVKNNKKPTAGIAVLLQLVDLGFKPHVYGFTHTLDHKYCTYYWPDNIRDKRKNIHHNFVKEYKIISFLRENGLVIWHE